MKTVQTKVLFILEIKASEIECLSKTSNANIINVIYLPQGIIWFGNQSYSNMYLNSAQSSQKSHDQLLFQWKIWAKLNQFWTNLCTNQSLLRPNKCFPTIIFGFWTRNPDTELPKFNDTWLVTWSFDELWSDKQIHQNETITLTHLSQAHFDLETNHLWI